MAVLYTPVVYLVGAALRSGACMLYSRMQVDIRECGHVTHAIESTIVSDIPTNLHTCSSLTPSTPPSPPCSPTSHRPGPPPLVCSQVPS